MLMERTELFSVDWLDIFVRRFSVQNSIHSLIDGVDLEVTVVDVAYSKTWSPIDHSMVIDDLEERLWSAAALVHSPLSRVITVVSQLEIN